MHYHTIGSLYTFCTLRYLAKPLSPRRETHQALLEHRSKGLGDSGLPAFCHHIYIALKPHSEINALYDVVLATQSMFPGPIIPFLTHVPTCAIAPLQVWRTPLQGAGRSALGGA